MMVLKDSIMKKYIFICLAVLLLPISTSAQALRGSYFFDSSIQRIKMNPAFSPRTNYVTVPVLGDLSFNINSNIGVSNFVFPKNGELYTYLNQNVSTAEFLALMPENPRIQAGIDTDILGTGFYISNKDFISFNIAERLDVNFNVPSELFVFLKDGMAKDTYNFNDFAIKQNAYLQVSAGYKRNLGDVVPGLSVGANVKFLTGLLRADMRINQASIYMSQDKWELTTDAEGIIYGKGIDVKAATEEGETDNIVIKGFGPAGLGFAVDFGAEYKLDLDIPVLDGINFSASVVDLGTIFYSEEHVTRLTSSGNAAFEGLNDINEEFDIKGSLKRITADFMALADFEEAPLGDTRLNKGLTPKAYVGVEAPMLNNLMSFGLLYSYMYGINEITASYNLKVKDIFNVGVNYSFLNNAKTVGFLMEFIPRNGVAIFLGTDYMNLQYTPQGFPVEKFVMNAKLGIQATFGSKFIKK
jgi:hypothetical protein